MGMSLSVRLGYGVDAGYDETRGDSEYDKHPSLPWERGYDPDEDEDEEGPQDFDDWYTKTIVGLEDPYDDFPPGYPERDYSIRDFKAVDAKYKADMEAWNATNVEWRKRTDAYHEAKREALKDCPIEVETYGYPEYRGTLIFVRGTDNSAYDSAVSVDLAEPEPNAVAAATKFCQDHGIPFENPSWVAAASYF